MIRISCTGPLRMQGLVCTSPCICACMLLIAYLDARDNHAGWNISHMVHQQPSGSPCIDGHQLRCLQAHSKVTACLSSVEWQDTGIKPVQRPHGRPCATT